MNCVSMYNELSYAYLFSSTRYLLASVNLKTQATVGEVRTYPVTMIVAEKLMAKMTKTLPGINIFKSHKITQISEVYQSPSQREKWMGQRFQ